MTTVATTIVDIQKLTDDELIRYTEELAADLRERTCDLVESLAEMDRRKLYREFQCASLFEYCTYRLRMSEAAAYRRIRAARAFQAYPPVKPLLRDGKLTLESLALLHPFLNDVDAGKLVTEAAGKRTWEVERLVAVRRTEEPRRDVVRFTAPILAVPLKPEAETAASLFDPPAASVPAAFPLADIPPAPVTGPDMTIPAAAQPDEELTVASPAETRSVAKIPEPTQGHPKPAPVGPAAAEPGIRVGFTADASFHRLLREAQAAMRHKYPDGRLDGVFRDALEALLRKKTPWACRKSR
ncbi:MAG: hypothetical protein Q8T11_06625 [Elusimicrobiota bacterium]|nr:hypothetical protein [Elusimicrobiota bacterium]